MRTDATRRWLQLTAGLLAASVALGLLLFLVLRRLPTEKLGASFEDLARSLDRIDLPAGYRLIEENRTGSSYLPYVGSIPRLERLYEAPPSSTPGEELRTAFSAAGFTVGRGFDCEMNGSLETLELSAGFFNSITSVRTGNQLNCRPETWTRVVVALRIYDSGGP
jgi:hypothetical protein